MPEEEKHIKNCNMAYHVEMLDKYPKGSNKHTLHKMIIKKIEGGG